MKSLFQLAVPFIIDVLQTQPVFNSMIYNIEAEVKKTIRTEILSVAFIILISVVFTCIVIFSLYSVGKNINILLMDVVNGPLWSILVFSLIAVVSSIALIFTLKTKPHRRQTTEDEINNEFKKTIITFLDGFSKGVEKN